MKYLKTFGLTAVAVTALLALAVNASATQLTSPAGTVYTGSLKVENNGQILLHGPFEATFPCNKSVIEATVEQHGSAVTAVGKVSKFSISECSGLDVSVLKPGTLEFHTDAEFANGNGIATLNGVEITYVLTTIFGNFHCNMEGNVNIGTVTGSKNTGGTANVPAPPIKDPTSFFCPEVVQMTGTYRYVTPDYLDVD